MKLISSSCLIDYAGRCAPGFDASALDVLCYMFFRDCHCLLRLNI
jgi:hypothetical protein